MYKCNSIIKHGIKIIALYFFWHHVIYGLSSEHHSIQYSTDDHIFYLHFIVYHCITRNFTAFDSILLNSIEFHCVPIHSATYYCIQLSPLNRLGLRSWVNETSLISEHYSDQMEGVMKQKSCTILDQMYLSRIGYLKHDCHAAFGHKRLCYKRAMADTFIFNLLYDMRYERKSVTDKTFLLFAVQNLSRKCIKHVHSTLQSTRILPSQIVKVGSFKA